MAFVTAIGDIFPLVTAIADTNVSNGCDNGAVTYPAGFEYSSYRSKSYGGPKTEELIKAPRNTK